MKAIMKWFNRSTEFVAAMMMAALFATFILQITIRYTARAEWIIERFPFLETSHFGWTLEFCLALWVWIIFFGNSFIVRERDHVTFELLYMRVSPTLRKWFTVFTSLAVCAGLLWSLEPTWSKFYILRLKKTASLSALLGDWIRMRHIYSVYALFLVVVALRYAWRALRALRFRDETDLRHYEEMIEEPIGAAKETDAT
jgi:C4-dicarboxylate transporter DctQ subunit